MYHCPIVDKLKKIEFTTLDHRPREVVSAVKVDDTIIIKFKDGSIYSSGSRLNRFACPKTVYWFSDELLKGLRVLRIINTSDILNHKRTYKKWEEFNRRESDRNELERLSKRCVFNISEEQKKVLKFGEKFNE